MPAIKVRAANENDLEDRIRRALEQRDREGTTPRELATSYTLSHGLPSATMLEEAKRGDEFTRTTRH